MIIVPLSKSHDRKNFDCGEESLNLFLRQTARQTAERRTSKTFVLVESEDSTEIVGYHTTLVTTVKVEQVPEKLGKVDVPALLLARLGVAQQWQGQGMGEVLLVDVLRRAVIISEQTGLYSVVLDALTERAKSFYLRYGFSELLDDPLHLYLPIGTILEFGWAASE